VCSAAPPSRLALDAGAALRLWALSEALLAPHTHAPTAAAATAATASPVGAASGPADPADPVEPAASGSAAEGPVRRARGS
jgi:hypothetical protein